MTPLRPGPALPLAVALTALPRLLAFARAIALPLPYTMPGMSAIAFDTLKFVNRLKAAGVAPEQAEAQVQAIAQALDDVRGQALEQARGELAGKADMQSLKTNVQTLRSEMQAVRAELKADLALLEQRMVIKLGSLVVVAVAAVAMVIKLL